MLNTAFYKIFYQNETLYTSSGDEHVPIPKEGNNVGEVPTSAEMQVSDAGAVVAYPYKILVLVDNPQSKDLDASEGVLLYKILKSVGYDSDDTDILNVGWVRGEELQNELLVRKAHYIISFGVPLKKLFIDLLLNPYEPTRKGNIGFLLADPLSVVEADVNIKKRLWGALKVMFPVV